MNTVTLQNASYNPILLQNQIYRTKLHTNQNFSAFDLQSENKEYPFRTQISLLYSNLLTYLPHKKVKTGPTVYITKLSHYIPIETMNYVLNTCIGYQYLIYPFIF